jgi:O-antigen ligase
VLAPALTKPWAAPALVGALVAVWLAWKSPAIPLALSGLPALITAVNGTNPLPKGGATFLVAAWVGLGVVMMIMRGEHGVALDAVMSPPVALAFLILGLMVIRVSGSPGAAYGSQKLQLYAADNLVFLVGAIFVGAGGRTLRQFLLITLAVVTAGGLVLLANLVTGHAHQQFSGRFAISQQQGAIELGRDSANGALIAIGLLLMSTSARVRAAAFVALPITLVALVGAGSRGPTLAFLVGLITLVALTAVSGRARRRLLVVAAAMVGAAVVIPIVVPGSAIGRSLSTIIGSASGLSSNGRSDLWSIAYNDFARHVWFGIGTGGFSALVPGLPYPHNLVLELSLEVGIIGGLAVVAMIVMFMRRLVAAWQRTTGSRQIEVTLLIALLASAVVNAMFSGAIMDNSGVWLWGGLGLGVYALEASRRAPAVARVSARTGERLLAR